MSAAVRYTEVAVTLPVAGRFHYRVPEHFAARTLIGTRVLVPFGRSKVTGVVVRAESPLPEGIAAVDLTEILDDEVPALPSELVELCLWVADYYEAPPGEAIKAALPAGSGVKARAVITLTDAGREAAGELGAALPAKQRAMLAKLAQGDLRVAGQTSATKAIISALITLGLAEQREHRNSRTRLKRERVAKLRVAADEARAKTRGPKRLAVIEELAAFRVPMTLAQLEQRVPGARVAARELVKAGLVDVYEREMNLEAVATGADMHVSAPHVLTDEQALAVTTITAQYDFKPFLLHGVTGSGKTEVYLRVIADALDAGKTALVLVPEISLTPQLAARFRARFGDRVAILHSGLSEQSRLGEWSRLRRGEASIAVGARSAVFAPLANLGVIVVDEEHDGSFKQDEGVRYHARDVALVRAQRAGAVCVLGSATPSLETMAHAERGSYTKLVLTQRPTARPMPTVEIIDLKTYMPDGEAMLSAPLRTAIAETLAAGDQTILFLNRRGFATFVLCKACGHSFRCPNCAVSLTYHRSNDRLSCHYCNYSTRIPEACPSCKVVGAIERKGLGTEKVAAAIAEAFPTARIARLDRDVASGAKVEPVLARVARREVDILVGTQMVTKGHDFPGVTLVGVLCADTGLNIPDFRASERTFQLLAQVAGRAGRGDRPGRVIVQTYRPTAPAVVAAAAHDYAQFYTAEMAARAELGYPPHGRLIAVRVDGANPHEVAGVAQQLAKLAQENAPPSVEIRGPVPAPIERIRARTRWQVWLRSADRHALRKIARTLSRTIDRSSTIRVALDIDPMSAL